jgi:hypothetical protein
MSIALKAAGAGVATETSGAACSPASPATVDAGDILIIHAYFEGTATAPNTPAGFTLLSGPHVIQSTIGRHWIYGKIADGSEDGAANALGSQAVTTMRSGRCYSFSGRVAGTITDLVQGFAATSHATDPQMPTVSTTIAGGLAVAAIAQNDNNAIGSATGESGGDWTAAVATFSAALTPGLSLALQAATPTADPGTISGGAVATANDPCGVIGFEIRPSLPAVSGTVAVTAADTTSAASGKVTTTGTIGVTAANTTGAASGKVTVAGTIAATLQDTTGAATGNVGNPAVTGTVSVTTAPTIAAASGKVATIGTVAASTEDTTGAADGTVSGGEQPAVVDGPWRLLTGEYPKPRRREERPQLPPLMLPRLPVPPPVAAPELRIVIERESPFREILGAEISLPPKPIKRPDEDADLAIALLLAA